MSEVPAFEILVPKELENARLDKAIVTLVDGASRARVRRALEDGAIRVNGRRQSKGSIVHEGDRLAIRLSDVVSGDEPAIPDGEAHLNVILEQESIVIVDKPAGQPCMPQRPGEKGTLANALVARYPEMAGIGYSPREPGLLHRLDTMTSGLVLAARSRDAFEELKAALFGGSIIKSYLLVCASDGLPDKGSISFPLSNHPKDGRRVLACVHPRDVMRYAPRPATTDYQVAKREGGRALVRATVSKALRHQIRAHFSALGFPLVGDVLYGGDVVEGFERHALHAATLSFKSRSLSFAAESPLPSELTALLAESAT